MKNIALIATAGFAAAASAQPLVLDSFADQFDGSGSDGRLTTTGSPTSDVSMQMALSSVLGGNRQATLNSISGDSVATGSISSLEGVLSLSTAAMVQSELVLLYGDFNGGVDVTSGGTNDRFEFDVIFSDSGSSAVGAVDFDLTLVDGIGTSWTERVSIQQFVAPSSPVTLSIDLELFSINDVLLSEIASIRFDFAAGGSAGDTTIGQLQFVPTPATAALFAGCGIAGVRRRR